MKFVKPEFFLVLVCIGTSLLGFGIHFVSNEVELSAFSVILLLVILGLSLYFTLYYGLKKFVQFRLRQIFKTVQTPPNLDNKNLGKLLHVAEVHVEHLSRQKQREIRNLKSQDEFRKEFIGNLSHELKTPAFSIQGYIESLIDGAAEDPTMRSNFLERARKATDRMIQLLEDLDTLTRLENPEIHIDKRSFNVVETITECYESLEWLAKEKEITLCLNENYNSFMVIGDKKRISQVFTNLVKNSILYGVEQGKTEITLTEVEDFLLIQVTDNGIGIDPKHWQRLFERFYRVEKSRNRHEGGTGLGLAIVKHILELHDQTITMRSTVGQGSTFSFCLPLSNTNVPLSSKGIPIK